MNFDSNEDYDRWLEKKQEEQILEDSFEIKEGREQWWKCG